MAKRFCNRLDFIARRRGWRNSNVQRLPRYPGGVALRLARIINFRPDKSVEEIEAIQRLRELIWSYDYPTPKGSFPTRGIFGIMRVNQKQ